jgi:16S rRNA (cytosine967-C5)-methyltransferase
MPYLSSPATRPVPVPSIRDMALNILSEAEAKGHHVEDLLAAALRRHGDLSRPDRALLLELVQGTKRWELRLDYVLSRLCRRPWGRVHPGVRRILRLGAYQLLFLDKIPPHAAVAEAGRLARQRRLPEAQVGFINAVLRRLAEAGPPPLPDPEDNPVTALAVATAHPEWLTSRWLARYGVADTQARLLAHNRVPPLTIRVNSLKTDPAALRERLAREGVTAEPGRYAPAALRLVEVERPPAGLASYREGLWLFQDEGAQVVTCLLPLPAGARVLEIGAGRGGKTTHLGEMLHNQGMLLAVDYHRRRLFALFRNLQRWGVRNAHPLRADAAQALPLRPESLDGVLLDAPCSALGIIRRHPELKTRLKESDLATFPPRQRAMLECAAPLLKPGGHLLYITCTTEPEENEDLVGAFVEEHPEFRLVYAPELLPAAARELLEPSGFFRTSPALHDLDGFFAALLQKVG